MGPGGDSVLHLQSQTSVQPNAEFGSAVSEEDLLRAQHYRLLAHALSGPLVSQSLAMISALKSDAATPLGRAMSEWVIAAQRATVTQLAEQYQELFIGLGRGVLVPYGSYYLTGFLHEKPLARLREDMARLGIERNKDVSEPEDHIASVLEIMAGLIDGSLGGDLAHDEQRRFYAGHIGSWARHFFRDLAEVRDAPFYAALGTVGGAFLEVEEQALDYG
ncbi:MAG: molecular chaperone [Hyphomicrobiaceae bacterium]